MTDIIELAKLSGAQPFNVHVVNGTYLENYTFAFTNDQLTKFAQLLTQQEPVAFRDFDVGDDGYFNFNESIKQTTPPDTQQKLYKAREALQRFVDDAINVDLGGGDAVVTTCESLEIAISTLKDIE